MKQIDIKKLQELADKKMLSTEIAEVFEVSKDTIKTCAKKHGINLYTIKDRLNDMRADIIEKYKAGKTINELREFYSYEFIKKTIDATDLKWRDASVRGRERRLSNEEVLSRLPKEQKYEVLGFENGKYIIKGEDGKVRHKPASRLHQKDSEMTFEKLNQIAISKGIFIIPETYVGYRLPVTVKCSEGHLRTYEQARSIVQNFFVGCNHCKIQGTSNEQIEVENWIKSVFPEATSLRLPKVDSSTPGPCQEIDIYLPSKKFGIEYCGVHWHSDKCKDKDYHLKKRELAEANGIELFHLYSDEWAEKRSIVESMIMSRLGKSNHKIGARKLVIKEVSQDESCLFLDQNHLMGASRATRAIGLFSGEELLTLLTYKIYKNGILDISRFCSKLGWQISGGLSKLISFLIKNHNPNQIVSFVDLRYGNGNSLKALGFELESIEIGWKWTCSNKTFNRLRCRANMDKRMLSEREHAEELGLHKIYDAGQAKFVKKINL